MYNDKNPQYLYPSSSTDFDLLKSKMNAPLLQTRYIQRIRLVNKLRANMGCKLILVISPAGYGKTTLVREWMEVISKTARHVAWVTLDKYDNNPIRFWSYISAALGKINPATGQAGNEIIEKDDEEFDFIQLNPLLNSIDRFAHSLTLVIDDYHVIQEKTIHQSLEYFLENLPGNLNLFLISRVNPPISLTKLKVRGQLYQLSAKDLAFTKEEAQAFMSGIMELNLSKEEIISLLDITEGWIAGLQLFGFSIKNGENTHILLNKLNAKNRLILDFLVEEVINQQTPFLREFLLKTSILEELSAPLCDAVMEINNSWDLLNQIEKANLFIIPIDEHGYWYRYHTLFSDTLKIYLSRLYPQELRKLHLNACAWFLNNGYVEKAAPHAIASGDLDKAAEIIDSFANQAVLQLNISELIGWLDMLPDELLGQHLGLFWPYAMANYHYGKLSEIEKMILLIEREIKKATVATVSDSEKNRIQKQTQAIQAAIACVSDDYHHGIELASLVLDDLRIIDPVIFGWLQHSLGYAHVMAGNPEKAEKSLRTAYQIALEHDLAIEYVYSRSELARVRKMQGCLHDAHTEFNKALSFAIDYGLGQDLIIFPQLGLAEINLEWNNLSKAEYFFKQIVEYFSRGDYKNLGWIYFIRLCSNLADYHLKRGNLDDALSLIQKSWDAYQGHQLSSQLVPEVFTVMARIWLATKDWEAANHWVNAREIYLEHEAYQLTAAEQISMCRIYNALGQPQKTLDLINRLTETTRQKTFIGENYFSIRILQILANYSLGNEKIATEELISILSNTEQEGYIGIFLAEGEKMRELFLKLLTTYEQNQPLSAKPYPSQEYIKKLCNAFKQNIWHKSEPGKKDSIEPDIVTPMIEALSKRELEVLRLMLEEKTVNEIAEELIISSNTVKAHIKNIYSKLNVSSRQEALHRAFGLKLISY